MRTTQKRIKFSKGMINASLGERTDLSMYDSSASLIQNLVSTVYGGLRTRRGTVMVDAPFGGLTETSGIASSSLGTADNVQDKNTFFITSAIGLNRDLFQIAYDSVQTGGVFKIRGIKFNYEAPNIGCGATFKDAGTNYYYVSSVFIRSAGVGITSAASFVIEKNEEWGTKPSFSYSLNEIGGISSVSITNSGWLRARYYTPANSLVFSRNASERIYNIGIYISNDNSTWTLVDTRQVSESAQDFDIDVVDSFQYIKVAIKDTDDSIGTSLSMQYAILDSGTRTSEIKSRLLSFVFNNEQAYLLYCVAGTIFVYHNDMLSDIVVATGLTDEFLVDFKVSQNEDTMIFTHPKMRTKQLQRTNSDWIWSDFDFQNIPYRAFNGETTTSKTVKLTPSADEGNIILTAESDVFTEDSIGQYIDGNGGRLKITDYYSTTKVGGYTIIPFYTAEAFSEWDYLTGYEPVWSDMRGWPTTCLFAQQRLWFGGSDSCPSTLWASRTNLYNDFKNVGNYDNDSINIDMLSADPIINLFENRGIHIFTEASEWTASEGSLTPNKITVVKNTQNGSLKRLMPVITGGVVLFIERNGKSLLSYVYDESQASYASDNISLLSNLIENPVALSVENNSSRDKGDFVYLVLDDGRMLVNCLVLNQNINSISIFETEGNIKDVCTVIDQTYITVEREGIIYIECIEDGCSTDCTINAVVNDEGIISNLNNYGGKYVYVYDDDVNYGRYSVENGTIHVFDAKSKSVKVGLAYSWMVDSNYININGKSFSVKKRISKATVRTQNTKYMTFCGQKKTRTDDVFTFYGASKYKKDLKFRLSGEFDPAEILSVELDINYGAK